MDDEIVDPLPWQPKGGGKVKNEAAKGWTRRALLDIGNLDTLQLIDGNINRPITRGFRANLLVNAQAAAVKSKRSVAAAADVLPVNRKCGNVKKGALANKKLSEKPNPYSIIDISSDDEEEIVKKKQTSDEPKPLSPIQINSNDESSVNPVTEGSSNKRTVRNSVKTLTSILTARSKAACGVIEKESEDEVLNIDAADVNDELAVVEYVDDLYKFYKSTEDDTRVQDYLRSQPLINDRMRKTLVDWLTQVHNSFQLMPESLFLTISILDRYLSMKVISRYELQLVGLGSMLIACKYEEIWPPQVKDLVCISDNAYVEDQVLAMEKEILGKLEWYLTVPTPYMFLVRYIKASVSPDSEVLHYIDFVEALYSLVCVCMYVYIYILT
ncbi:hypothetical protein PTKIN_Ptkin11bG0102400 [Pterospermum kingtungense]